MQTELVAEVVAFLPQFYQWCFVGSLEWWQYSK